MFEALDAVILAIERVVVVVVVLVVFNTHYEVLTLQKYSLLVTCTHFIKMSFIW